MNPTITDNANQIVDELRHRQVMDANVATKDAMVMAIGELIKFLDGKVTKTEVVNQLESIATPDVAYVVDAITQLDASVKSNRIELQPVIDGLKALEAQLATLPKDFPEVPQAPDNVAVNNLKELGQYFATLEKAIKGITTTVKAPDVKVDVPKPQIIVQEANLLPLKTSLTEVVTAIRGIVIPQPAEPDLSDVEKKLEEANKLLKKLVEKPIAAAGGGGGGGTTVFKDASNNAGPVTLTADNNVPTVNMASLVTRNYDYVAVTAGSTTDTYAYKSGGSGGPTVTTMVITYTDTTKNTIQSMAKT